jgi:hypothetical protein
MSLLYRNIGCIALRIMNFKNFRPILIVSLNVQLIANLLFHINVQEEKREWLFVTKPECYRIVHTYIQFHLFHPMFQ